MPKTDPQKTLKSSTKTGPSLIHTAANTQQVAPLADSSAAC
jgi:hypothetical protein